jgi:SAM-dependent methyltransferase
MKRCVQCGANFTGREWQCPDCDYAPVAHGQLLSFCEPEGSDGFDPAAFDHLVELEQASFWFRSRNRLLIWAFGEYFGEAESFLEVGCGTGYVLEGMHGAFPGVSICGAELHSGGLRYAAARLPGIPLMQFDARDMPFVEEFDVVGAFDVLEHIEADEAVLAGMRAALKPGGGMLLTVPQHPWLWTAVDEYAEHKRRYGRDELIRKVTEVGFTVRRVTSFISLLLPAMVIARMREKLSRRPLDPSGEHHNAEKAAHLLEGITTVERGLITRGINFRAGGSLLLAAVRS